MKYLVYRVACSKRKNQLPEIQGIGTLALNLAEGSARSTADLGYCIDKPSVMVEWFAQRSGALGDRLIGWHGREMQSILSVALANGIDFGHVFQRHQHVAGERHQQLHAWLQQHCGGGTLAQQSQVLKIKPADNLAQRLSLDCFVLACLWIKIRVVLGELDIRGRASTMDLVGSAFRCSDASPAVLRQVERASKIINKVQHG